MMSISVEASEARDSLSDDKELVNSYERLTALDGKRQFALAAAESHKEEVSRLREYFEDVDRNWETFEYTLCFEEIRLEKQTKMFKLTPRQEVVYFQIVSGVSVAATLVLLLKTHLVLGEQYVLRDNSKGTSGKDKSAYIWASKRDDQLLSNKPIASAATLGNDAALEEESGDFGKKKILLLKGEEKEIPHVSGGSSMQQSTNAPIKNSPSSTMKQNQRREASEKIIRSIPLKDNSQINLLWFDLSSKTKLQVQKRTKDLLARQVCT